ncbi:hypothetical protein PICMEDRAFT_35807, partial [Pichia membranifaciens NRRL Y-2026]
MLTPVSSLPLSDYIQNEINNNGASRAICLSNLPYNLSEKILITELSKFGALQSVEYNVDKNAAFVYFTSIFNAIKCFDQLPLSNSILSDSKIFYSNDGNSVNIPAFSASNSFMNTTFANKSELDLFKENRPNNMLTYSRTSTSLSSPLYLGGLPSGTTSEDVCNKIRGGILENIKLLSDRKAAFLTFVYHHDAANFIARTFKESLFINSKCAKVGWGRNSGNLNPEIQLAVDNGACRNLYIGVNEELEDQDDYELIPDTLRRDFSIFGEIEQINYFKNGSCAFINFTNILSCIKAVNDFQSERSKKLHNSFDNRYTKFRISYGKDRCGNPPK